MKLIDLSQTIAEGMPLFSEDAPQPRITPWLRHSQSAFSGRYEGCTVEITEVQFVTSVGTYLDSPYHFDVHGTTIERLSLDQLVLPGIAVRCYNCEAEQSIEPDVLAGIDIAGKAVLFDTGWSRYWGQRNYHKAPFLSAATAVALRDGGAKLVGVDFLVADDIADPRRPVHVTLLHNNILIVENLTHLERLPDNHFIFHAVPAKVSGAAAFPVRAYATIGD